MNMHDPFADLPPADEMPPEDRFPPTDSYEHDDMRPHPPKSSFRFIAVGDLEYRDPEFTVDGLIETETLGLFFGDPGCGKSFFAVDLALSVATGTAFHERNTKQGAVFFIAGEGHNGLARRFAAWSKARGIPLAGVPLFKSERAAQFLDMANAKAVTDAVRGLAAQHGLPALIIIDTLARNFGPGDENNTKEMSEFIVAIDDMKANFPGCCVLIVHHSGHADKQRARGAMALKGALDFEFRIEKNGHDMQLINTKMKDAEAPQDMFFSFRQVELNGSAKSAVLESTDAPEPKKGRLSPNQKLALEALQQFIADNGQPTPGGTGWPESGTYKQVSSDEFMEFLKGKMTADSPDSRRRTAKRAFDDLLSKSVVQTNAGCVWII